MEASAGSVRDTCSAANVMEMSCRALFWGKVSVCVCVCVCACLCLRALKGQKGQERKKVREKYLAGRERRLTVKANICLMLCAALFYPLRPTHTHTRGTDSNNCEHLGSLQALHANPLGLFTWDRRPRAASFPTQEQPGSRQIIARRPGGTPGPKFCQTVLH